MEKKEEINMNDKKHTLFAEKRGFTILRIWASEVEKGGIQSLF